ncbi:ABC transporter substrate-binding protein [Sphingomonas sp. CA1-15]|uniref:ABC transporter substrate-binding protein n=1 Tax=Sphingomonas immobilis TaxID=3063997 RepID=A0ABT9A022_9SPHN|nr:ABC transporter substrate-binding protein [Sphingomonas sp. CA1-15]
MLLAVATLTACGSQKADVLHVANQKGSTRAMMLAAGVLDGAPYTVEWSEFPAAQTLLEAVSSGSADLGLAGDAPFIFAYQSGSPIKAVGALATAGRPADALAVVVREGSPLRSVADLAGKTVATTRGSIGHHLLLQALERAHIPASRVKVSLLAPSDAKAAFDSGAVDAWASWTPYTNIAIKEGARVIVDAKDYDLPVAFDVANAAAITPKRALIRDFLAREAKALDWARAHPEAYAQVLSRETGLPIDIARASFDRNNRTAVAIAPAVLAHEQAIADRFGRAGLIAPTRPIAEAFDASVGSGLFKTQE